ncbi:MAG TPA: universal stress protein [Pseudomonadales bacterium]
MYRQILIAVDLAGEPEPVLEKGKALAELHQADFKVVYCIDQPVTPFGELSIPQPLLNMAQLKQEIFPHFKAVASKAGVPAERLAIEIGHHADTILQTAEKRGSDLIVLGSQSRRGLRALLGSTANSVLQRATCDVLAVRL